MSNKMNIEIPEFLPEMSKQMNEQNNRMTADPLFEVRYKKYLITEEGYGQHHWAVYAPDSEGYAAYASEDVSGANTCEDEFIAELWEKEEDWCVDHSRFELSDHYLAYGDVKEFFLKNFKVESDMELPNGWKILFMQEIEETFVSRLTESDAQAAIDRKQHDYPQMYIYATSLYWAPHMKQLRNWLLSLSAGGSKNV